MSVDAFNPHRENFADKVDNGGDRGDLSNPIEFRDPFNKLNIIQNFELLKREEGRLKTFINWPNKHVTPKQLAAAGFYYLGEDDFVQCAFCGIKGHRWEAGDKPMEDHIKWNKQCPFVVRNTESTDDAGSHSVPSQDICGNNPVVSSSNLEVFPNSETEDQSFANLERFGINKTRGPSHPDRHQYETRLQTFANWPKSLKQKPVDLASAGFFYLGIGDQTLCFHCGGGLKDWEETDDPWEQHALWFPKCSYLLLKKGTEYVDEIREKHTNKDNKDQEEATTSGGEDVAPEAPKTPETESERSPKPEDGVKLCKICYKNELRVVFLPCGHMVACADCASALKECAICRKPLQATVRAFIS